ncbi:MAG: hypothetical protein ACR2IV_24380 [Bryobacteraceae bacterium]
MSKLTSLIPSLLDIRNESIQTLIKNWWLLALCGVLHGLISVIYLIMQATGGPLTFHAWKGTVGLLGKLSLAAGACTIAAGIWGSAKGKCWLLSLNGLTLSALGLIYTGIAGFSHSGVVGGARISFRTIALLIILMAMSIGILEFIAARTLRRQRHVADGWFLGMAGVASVGFALAFFALGFRWIKLGPGSHLDLLWLGSYFGFSAVCMLGLALRLHSRGRSQSGQWQALPLLSTSN